MVNDKMSVVIVKKKSNGELKDKNELQENEIFGGDKNPLTFQSYYDLSLRCSYEFTYFPFDHQWCHITVSNNKLIVWLPTNKKLFGFSGIMQSLLVYVGWVYLVEYNCYIFF